MDALTPEDPTHIGPYRLIARLGAGGMGLVYLGRSDVGRTVAVKVVQREYAAQPEFRRRFAREVAAARRVGGSWTADVLDAETGAGTGTDGGGPDGGAGTGAGAGVEVPWVATQYIAGPDLTTVVARDFGPLPEHSVRVLANRLARALEAVHEAGLIHRDLKPSNVLVTVDGPRVIDFGIARAMDSLTGDSLHTRTGMLIGSPGFMSPEQVRGRELTPASDVFCLGAVLVYAATGRLLFGATDTGLHAHLFRIAEEEPDLTGVPESLVDLVRACLEKDPAGRPTPEQIAARTDGDERGVWLPGEVLAQLGRHAAQLLDFVPVPRPGDPAAAPAPQPVPSGGTPGSGAPTPGSGAPPPGFGPPTPGYGPPPPGQGPSTPGYGPAHAAAPTTPAPGPVPPAPAYTPTAPAHGVTAPPALRGRGLAVVVLAQLAVLFGATPQGFSLHHGESSIYYLFVLSFGAFLLLGGHLADRVGRRRTLTAGLAGLLVAAGTLVVLPGEAAPGWTIGVRILQGASGALVTAAALALVATGFPEPRARARAFGVYATVGVCGTLLASLPSGWMTWELVLSVVALLALVALAATRALPHDRPEPTGTRFDALGVLLGTLGLAALLCATVEASLGWSEASVLIFLLGGAVLLAAFLGWQRRTASPLLPPYLLKNRDRLGGLLALGLTAAGALSLLPSLTHRLVLSSGYTASQVELAALPLLAAVVVGATQISPRLLNRGVAPRVLVVTGLLGTAAGAAPTITGLGSRDEYAALLPFVILTGLALGTALTPLFAAAVSSTTASAVLPGHAGALSAAVLAVQSVGEGLGAAAVGHGSGPPWWVIGFLALASLVAALTIRRPRL
ncbi:bifunctional serine/threonine protein kinase/MFS transporter [Streptomyces sp. NPDC098101]|uniref:bifunctional serine/threonine protein kinase/MFS transporter n=1 Tax=Streptomyces sp. NPDC098101 TaxID=3366096 RepID=UPI003823F00C